MISLYHPGSGFLHRSPAWLKLLALAAIALVLSLTRPGIGAILIVLLAVCALYPLAGLPWRMLLLGWWRLRWLILVLGAALWLFLDMESAVVNTGRVVALILLADLVTRTTTMSALMTVIEGVLRPLRRFGVEPELVALTVSLAIAMIPVIASLAAEVRDAQRARGVRLGPNQALPLLVLTMRHADRVGEALVARGLGR